MLTTLFLEILNWSEVWALLIPLTVYVSQRNNARLLLPLQWYLFFGLILNLFITLISNIHEIVVMFYGSNHIFYNLHSVVKVAFFGWFIMRYLPPASANIIKLVFVFYGAFILFNFSFFESPMVFSSRLLTIESIILIFLGISWYLYTLHDDGRREYNRGVVFLVITGIVIYESVNFFIFLFYKQLIVPERNFALLIWNVHDIAFVVMCIFLARAFQKSGRPITKKKVGYFQNVHP
jgi:hypothetical protein